MTTEQSCDNCGAHPDPRVDEIITIIYTKEYGRELTGQEIASLRGYVASFLWEIRKEVEGQPNDQIASRIAYLIAND
jgi:hypothetical protein